MGWFNRKTEIKIDVHPGATVNVQMNGNAINAFKKGERLQFLGNGGEDRKPLLIEHTKEDEQDLGDILGYPWCK